MDRVRRCPFPIDPSVVPNVDGAGWLPTIAGLSVDEVLALLRRRWAGLATPYSKRPAEELLSRPLVGLSIDADGDQWLTFEDEPQASLHLAPRRQLPARIREQFPFEAIDGLAEFVENFGGTADSRLPPCPWFLPASDVRVVSADCPDHEWGKVGEWEGSLTLYNTASGNFIVVRPDGTLGKWEHDIGWYGDDDPFVTLGWDMATLVDEYVAYLAMDEDECESLSPPFHY